MRPEIEIEDQVAWSWSSRTGTGTVVERDTDEVKKTIEGSEITPNATEEEPACLIEQDDGDLVLESSSELQRHSGN